MSLAALELDASKKSISIISAKFISIVSFLFFAIVSLILVFSQDIHADDAYMFYRYAYNLNTYGLFTWNAADGNTFGITSLFHFFIVDLVFLFCKQPNLVLKLATYLPIIAVLMYIYLHLSVKWKLRIREILLVDSVLCYVIINRTFQIHATSGMDTMLSFVVYLFFVLFFYQNVGKEIKSVLLTSVLAVLVVLTRPDSIMFLFGFFISFLIVTYKNVVSRAFILKVLFTCFLLGGGIVIALVLIFKDPLPLPFYVKSLNEYDKLDVSYQMVKVKQITNFIIFSLPLAISFLFIKKKYYHIIIPVLVGAAMLVCYFSTVTWIMGYEFRFLFPLYGVFVGMLILHFVKDNVLYKKGFFLYAVFLVLVGASTLRLRSKIQPLEIGRSYLFEISKELSLADNHITIAATEHGIVSALNTQKYICDLSGLHNPGLKKGFNLDFLYKKKPDLIIMPSVVYVGMIDQVRADSVFKNEYYFLSENNESVKYACSKMFIDGIAIKKSSGYFSALEKIAINAALNIKNPFDKKE